MSLSSISLISSVALQTLMNIVATVASLIVKFSFTSIENSPQSTFTTLDLLNTSGITTDGTLSVLQTNNYINNSIVLTTAQTTGVTIMFRMKLTATIYTSNNNRRNIVKSKGQILEDGYWAFYLYAASGTHPNLAFLYMHTPVSGGGNNKVNPQTFLQIPSASMAYDNSYHHYCVTTIKSGTTIYHELFRNGVKITQTSGGIDASWVEFLNMKRITFFPENYTIIGDTVTINHPPAVCNITDFRIYSKLLTPAEIITCSNGGEIT